MYKRIFQIEEEGYEIYEIVLKITIMFEERKRKELEGKNGKCDERMINEINDLNLHKHIKFEEKSETWNDLKSIDVKEK